MLRHVFDWLSELGMARIESGGVSPFSWRDIVAWQSLSGAHIEPREAALLHEASCAYVAYYNKAHEFMCPPPWREGGAG